MLTPEIASAMLQAFVQEYGMESTTTRRVLAAVPNDKASWTPDPKSKSALELAAHIATSEMWFLEGIANRAFGTEAPPELKSVDEILKFYDDELPVRLAKVQALSGEQLCEIVDFYGMKMPNVVYLSFMMKHSVHHRGQLSVYLRPMGGKVPSIYGGSADEPYQG